jgi:hypothetical protein
MSDAAPSRFDALRQWAAERHGLPPEAVDLRLAAGDASFRRYYRLHLPDGSTRMLMDAPPAREDSRPFVAIARRLGRRRPAGAGPACRRPGDRLPGARRPGRYPAAACLAARPRPWPGTSVPSR